MKDDDLKYVEKKNLIFDKRQQLIQLTHFLLSSMYECV